MCRRHRQSDLIWRISTILCSTQILLAATLWRDDRIFSRISSDRTRRIRQHPIFVEKFLELASA